MDRFVETRLYTACLNVAWECMTTNSLRLRCPQQRVARTAGAYRNRDRIGLPAKLELVDQADDVVFVTLECEAGAVPVVARHAIRRCPSRITSCPLEMIR